MRMAEESVGVLLENLEQVLLYNAELIGTAKDEMEGLRDDLVLFKAFIKDSTEKRNSTTETLQALVDRIRNVVHKSEDVIDKFVVQSAIYKARNAFWKVIHRSSHLAAVRDIAKKIEKIREMVKKIYERFPLRNDTLNIEKLPERCATQEKQSRLKPLQLEQTRDEEGASKKKTPATMEDSVVGFDEEANTVITRLNGEQQDLDIITIVGVPGLGKTTLARKIYNDPAIEYEFFTRAWVYVSQNYIKREVFLSILGVFIQKTTDYTHIPDDVIAEKVHKFLEKRKYLIVMDDVWTRYDWNDLKKAFPNNKKGSRILITSRYNEVALYANPIGEPHSLKVLSQFKSWELIESKIFGKGKYPQKEMEIFGAHMAAKCNGLPLLIVVIAGILLNNCKESEWLEKLAENFSPLVVKNKDDFSDVIAMSYNHLPYHLKLCFLYLVVFPEDYEIPVWKLICLWIAEGFIERDGELSLEDTAEVCVADLVNRNLLMVSKRSFSGQIKTCRVHSMLYDFCKKEAARQNLYQEIKSSDQATPENCRRVCVHLNVMDYIISKPRGKHVRSFLCFPQNEITLRPVHISIIPKAFELLKVLDVKSIIFIIFPKGLLQLALLRYLALSCNIKGIPKSMCKLFNLQTLIILTKWPTLQLKEDMWKMYQLRHFQTNASALLPPPPLGTQKGNENMKSLSMISPESCTKDVFERTANIKKLGVRGKVVVLFEKLFDNVTNLEHLTNLKLYNHDATNEVKVLILPPANKFPKMLKKLTLSNTLLDWEQMQILGDLEKLEVLKLKENAFKGKIWEPKDGGFLSLKFLHIGRTNLMSWKASQRHFPSLKHLVLQHCENLVGVPSGFAEIKTFQVLDLYFSNPRASFSARKIQHRKMLIAVKETKTCGVFKLSVCPPDM